MVETFFFICCYCQIPIENVFLKRHFFPLLPKYSYVVSLFVEIPFHPSLSPLFWTWPWTKIKIIRKERCVESLTKNIPIIHSPAMEIPAKNTIGLPIKWITFTSATNEKPWFLRQYLLFSTFTCVKVTLKPLL